MYVQECAWGFSHPLMDLTASVGFVFPVRKLCDFPLPLVWSELQLHLPAAKGAPSPCVLQAPAFLGCVQLGKCSKLNQKSSLRRGPVTSFAALLLKFQKGYSDNKKYTQFLVKLMSCCCPFRETLISSQRAGVWLSRARGAQLHLLTGVQPPTESAAELPEEEKSFPCFALGSLVPGTIQLDLLLSAKANSHTGCRQIPTNEDALQEFTLFEWQVLFQVLEKRDKKKIPTIQNQAKSPDQCCMSF